jgi:hypothetical protein
VTVVRLVAEVELRHGSDGSFSTALPAIVDTGAPFSVLPRSVWEPLSPIIDVPDSPLGGLSQRRACRVPAAFGRVWLRLVDLHGNTTKAHEVPAYLARTERVPLLVGFADLLTELNCHFDFKHREAWVEADR